MKRLFRRSALIALALTVMCICAVPVFAADTFHAGATYENNKYDVSADAAIYQRSTWGMVETECDTLISTYHYVHCAYRYHTYDEDEPVVNGTMVSSQNSFYATVSFSDSTILCMERATYTFEAHIPASYGTQVFTVVPTTITFR